MKPTSQISDLDVIWTLSGRHAKLGAVRGRERGPYLRTPREGRGHVFSARIQIEDANSQRSPVRRRLPTSRGSGRSVCAVGSATYGRGYVTTRKNVMAAFKALMARLKTNGCHHKVALHFLARLYRAQDAPAINTEQRHLRRIFVSSGARCSKRRGCCALLCHLKAKTVH